MIIQRALHPAGYKQVTMTGSVVTIPQPLNAVHVTIQPNGDIRFRDDGKAPTLTLGMTVANAATMSLYTDARELKMIGANGTLVDLLWHTEI